MPMAGCHKPRGKYIVTGCVSVVLAPAESFERGAWGFLGSVGGGVASLARCRGVQKRGVLFQGSVDGGATRLVRLWTLEENIILIKQCLQCAVGTEELRK